MSIYMSSSGWVVVRVLVDAVDLFDFDTIQLFHVIDFTEDGVRVVFPSKFRYREKRGCAPGCPRRRCHIISFLRSLLSESYVEAFLHCRHGSQGASIVT